MSSETKSRAGRCASCVVADQLQCVLDEGHEGDCMFAYWPYQSSSSADTGGREAAGLAVPPENCYVAWCRYKDNRIFLCDSDAPGAFKVYRWAALTARGADTGGRKTAWLIERCDREAIEWLICDDGGFEWIADPLKPIRFCRREDADQIASLFDDIDVRIVEHQWGL